MEPFSLSPSRGYHSEVVIIFFSYKQDKPHTHLLLCPLKCSPLTCFAYLSLGPQQKKGELQEEKVKAKSIWAQSPRRRKP